MSGECMGYLEVDVNQCIGCRTCEIACSYHHRRAFNPKMASLKIRTVEEGPGILVVLYKDFSLQEMEKRLPCDCCQGESIALCKKYCPVGAIKLQNQGVHFNE
jgi:Fe-S-cluster-containing hydrogenase component 2